MQFLIVHGEYMNFNVYKPYHEGILLAFLYYWNLAVVESFLLIMKSIIYLLPPNYS